MLWSKLCCISDMRGHMLIPHSDELVILPYLVCHVGIDCFYLFPLNVLQQLGRMRKMQASRKALLLQPCCLPRLESTIKNKLFHNSQLWKILPWLWESTYNFKKICRRSFIAASAEQTWRFSHIDILKNFQTPSTSCVELIGHYFIRSYCLVCL